MPITVGLRPFQAARQGQVVLEGVVAASGQTIVHWLTPAPRGAVAVFDDFDGFLETHVYSHPEYHTCVAFSDDERHCHGPERARHHTFTQ